MDCAVSLVFSATGRVEKVGQTNRGAETRLQRRAESLLHFRRNLCGRSHYRHGHDSYAIRISLNIDCCHSNES